MDAPSPKDISYLTCPDGTKRAYARYQTKSDRPGLVFLAGHGSDMLGAKAQALHQWTEEENIPFLRFDYFGHGLSDGSFLDGNISKWVDDCVFTIDQLTSGPQILVGSSLGGWLMIRTAQERPDRIAGLVGIAAAPDFTETLIWNALSDEQKILMQEAGQITLPNPYAPEDVVYPYHLITDGRRNLVLDKPIKLDVPIALLHGMADEEVPWQTTIDISDRWQQGEVHIILNKQAGHRYSEVEQIAQIISTTRELYQKACRA